VQAASGPASEAAAEVESASAKPARGAAPGRQLGREREASWALAAQCAAVLRAVHAWAAAERGALAAAVSSAKLRALACKVESMGVGLSRKLEAVPGAAARLVTAAPGLGGGSASAARPRRGAAAKRRPVLGKRAKQQLRSRNEYIDEHLVAESGDDDFADLEDFIAADDEDE